MRSLAALLLIPFALGAQVALPGRGGTPIPTAPPTPPGDLCTVEGQVFDATSGEPLRKASITMNLLISGPMRPAGPVNYGATTDASGKYTITRLEPGQYRIVANHTGFLSMQYNARRPDGPGTNLELARGQSMTGVNFRLTPHGVITGHVLDEDGDPLQYATIQLARVVYVHGRKQYQQQQGSNTNDLGEFRIFGITPGKYYLSATERNRGGMPVSGQQQEDYVPTYYPGVTDAAAATPLEMKPGQQLQGINLKLAKVRTVSLKGTVVNNVVAPPVTDVLPGRGGPVRINVSLQLEERNQFIQYGATQGAALRPDGTFEFQSVAPGPYNLVALTVNSNQRHVAIVPVDVGETNVENVTVTINPGATVSGRIRMEGDSNESIPNFTVRLTSWMQGNNFGMVPQPARVDSDRTFRFEDVNPGAYEVNINPLPGTLYVKSIKAGDTDVLDDGLDLSNGAGASLDVVIGANAPKITGVVQNSTTQQPAVAATVVLIPQEPARRNTSMYYMVTNTDQNGNFTMNRVNPGQYKLYAWEDVESNAWYDPDFMRLMESKGSPVSVQEGTPVSLQLSTIPASSGN